MSVGSRDGTKVAQDKRSKEINVKENQMYEKQKVSEIKKAELCKLNFLW